jgi:hypothetical protein
MIYRGKQATENCPESVGRLLKSTYPSIQLMYAGPDEPVQVNEETLARVDVFAQPGGPGMSPSRSRYQQATFEYTLTCRTFLETSLTLRYRKMSMKRGPKSKNGRPPSVLS